MKDLDFDELDKAVNSLMTGAGTAKQPSQDGPDTDGEKTLDITPTLASDAAPSFDDLNKAVAKTTGATVASSDPVPAPTTASTVVVPTPAPVADTTPQPTVPDTQSPLAARRGGRFMDVVHPSSDMKKTVVPPRPVSREGVMVGRTPAASVEPAPEVPASADPKTETPAAAEATSAEPATSGSEWPDPLEMADFKTPDAPKMTNDNLAADLLAEADKAEQDEKTDSGSAPLTSPFLSGAKVEKRPLGSGTPAYIDDTPTTEKEDKTVDNPDAQLPASPSDAPVLPEELQGDLMAIEADTHMGVPKTDESHPVAPVEALPEEKTEPEPVVAKEEKPREKASEPTTERAVPTGPISIPQQYREEPSTTADEKAGTIYDTDSYHKPLAHPAKKKPGWTWVVAIIVILIVGAGGGAALYFLGIV